jgi:hypothetical protein
VECKFRRFRILFVAHLKLFERGRSLARTSFFDIALQGKDEGNDFDFSGWCSSEKSVWGADGWEL